MQISKAIITAAAPNQSHLPLQSVVNRSGEVRTALELMLDDISGTEIEEVAIVVCPGMVERYSQAAGVHAAKVSFIEQDQPRGYADALSRGRDFVGGEPFLHLVGDHLYVSRTTHSCAEQLLQVAKQEGCSVSAIQPTRESRIHQYGTIGGSPVAQKPGLYEITAIVEKPTPTEAEQTLIVAGQRAGHYLCFFGMHVLTPEVFEFLDVDSAHPETIPSLSSALHLMASGQRFLAMELDGVRYNIGEKYGLLIAQLAIALSGEDRDRVLTELLELVATN